MPKQKQQKHTQNQEQQEQALRKSIPEVEDVNSKPSLSPAEMHAPRPQSQSSKFEIDLPSPAVPSASPLPPSPPPLSDANAPSPIRASTAAQVEEVSRREEPEHTRSSRVLMRKKEPKPTSMEPNASSETLETQEELPSVGGRMLKHFTTSKPSRTASTTVEASPT
ncbi:MAG: hypothetical protein AAGJ35_13650, partial [Myxococcota bacterium]